MTTARIRYTVAAIALLLTLSVAAQDSILRYSVDMPWDGKMDTVDGYVLPHVDDMYIGGGAYGQPIMPTRSHIISLPKGSKLRIERWAASDAMLVGTDIPLLPSIGATLKDQEPRPRSTDKSIYSSNKYHTQQAAAKLEHLGAMGQEELFLLTLSPMEYNPVEGSVLWHRHIDIVLAATPASMIARSDKPRVYLIVSRPEFKDGLRPFVRWKQQEGFMVEEIYANVSQRDSIKSLIAPYFVEQGNEPQYVLIVGDATKVQAFVGNSHPEGLSSHSTDLPYVSHSEGYLPNAMIGRWPVADTTGLRHVVEKTLRYEQCRGIDTATLKHIMLVAGKESSGVAPTTTNGQVNYVAHEIATSNPRTDTICYRNPESETLVADIKQKIAQGLSLINYTAHCTQDGWTKPRLWADDISDMDESQPTVYVNNCCSSNEFTGYGFGKELLLKPIGGAVATVGATNSTLWNEDYYWAVGPKYPFALMPTYDAAKPGAFDRWGGRIGDISSVGELMTAGNLAVTASGTPYSRFYWEIYCVLGDPSLMPYVGVPQQASITNISLSDDKRFVTVSGTPGSTVSVVQDSLLLGVGLIGNDSTTTIELLESVAIGNAIITATGRMLIPATDTLRLSDGDIIATARQVAITDSTVCFSLSYHGQAPLSNIKIGIDTCSNSNGCVVAFEPQTIDTLWPEASVRVCIAYSMSEVGMRPQWSGVLSATAIDPTADDSTRLLTLGLHHIMNIHYPSAQYMLTTADGSTARMLTPGETYRLTVQTDGYGDVDYTVEALPNEEYLDETFTIPDGTRWIRIASTLRYGQWSKRDTVYLNVGQRHDGFEQGIACYPWEDGGSKGWQIDSTVRYDGQVCMRSGKIDYRQTSDLILQIETWHDDSISFRSRISSELNYDKFYFYIDDSVMLSRSGDGGWKLAQFALPAGRHTLLWRYLKDESTTVGSDCAWLDDVRLPLAYWHAPYGCDDSVEEPIQQITLTDEEPLLIVPNPTNGVVRIVRNGITDAVVRDMTGRTVAAPTSFSVGQCSIDLTDQPSGIYLIEAHGDDWSIHSKIILEKRQ